MCLHLAKYDSARCNLLNQCVSCVSHTCHNLANANEGPQIVTRAQERLFSGPKQKGVNVITMGYRGVCGLCGSHTRIGLNPLKSYQNCPRMKAVETRSGVINFFVNTNVTALQGSDWETLLGRCVHAPCIYSLCVLRLVMYQDWGECYVTSTDGS
jgi:hypothetical protein